MPDSITNVLGVGSGIDISALVNSLVDAQFATKTALLDTREETLQAQISAAGELKSAMSGFSNALSTLARSGSLSTQPTSGDASILRTSLLPGASVAGLSGTVEVRQIAQAQASHSGLIADPAAALGGGTLTLTFGTATVSGGAMTAFTAGSTAAIEIAIDSATSTLSNIVSAINAKRAGVTASIVGDANGSRLVLKGATGEAQAFTLTASDPALAAVEVGVGKPATIGTAAQDALVSVDGVEVRRATNSISNLIAGVRLDLVSAKPGTLVQLGATPPTEGLSQAVQDFVSTYNELKSLLSAATDPKGGALRTDSAARTLVTNLSRLAGTALLSDPSGPRTLAEIGVATQRDGTLTLDTARLGAVLVSNPQAVEAMFAAGAGLPAAMQRLSLAASSARTGLGASEARYAAQADDLSDQREAAVEAAATMRTRMTQQFASMDARVAAYRATQSFLEQQVDAWNNSNR
jgi:flagellar hook-associated protein 2